MRFWCSQVFEPWTWTPQPYFGVWMIGITLIVLRARALRAKKRDGFPPELLITNGQRVAFWSGLALFWIASDWPVGPLGASYLASVHMVQYMLYTLGAAPLLLISIPEWRSRELLAKYRLEGFVRLLSRPLAAVIAANGILIVTHAPITVDLLRSSQMGSFFLDMVWLLGGFALWLPVAGPFRDWQIKAIPLKCVYLFGAAGLLPMLPGGFITFAEFPLYEVYEIAPSMGISTIGDQQMAGAIMKIGSIPVIWTVMFIWWARWSIAQQRADSATVRVRTTSSSV